MKTGTKIVAAIMSFVFVGIAIIGIVLTTPYARLAGSQSPQVPVRDVALSEIGFDDPALSAEFEQYELRQDDDGVAVTATKTFDASVLSDTDLIAATEETFTVRYEVQYIEAEETLFLTAVITGEEELAVVETVPGLVTYNPAGEADVLFSVDGECFWLSELQNSESLDEIGWFSSLFQCFQNAIKKAVETVVHAVMTVLAPAIRIVSNLSVRLLGSTAADISAAVLDMYKDEQQIYHAKGDCWQQYFGYTDLYDVVFNAVTKMRSKKFPFDVTGDGVEDHILWAWKGDYLNLGAGAELGVYKRWGYAEDIWIVDKSLAMKMTLRLDYNHKNIINWQPREKQWWITGFHWRYQNVNRDALQASFTVRFNSNAEYNAFKDKWYKTDSPWIFSGSRKASFTF